MKAAIGQDSHRFDFGDTSGKPLVMAGVVFEGEAPFESNSDGDVILHAVTRAVSGITAVDVIGTQTKGWIREGILDSKFYLQEALKDLDGEVILLSVSIECQRPRVTPHIPAMRRNLAELLHTDEKNIGITANSGEELTDFGRGLGVNVFAVITVD